MKILHLCLACFYIDKYSYQENLLPKEHKKCGFDVRIIASTETFVDGINLGYIKPSKYENENNIIVERIPYVSWLPSKIVHKLRIYPKVYEKIDEFSPDIIFIHECQFLSILQVVKYAEKHPQVKIFVDGHADFSNSARGFISRNILHRLIYRFCAQKILPYTTKFWGTLPARVDFFHNVYGIPKEKIDFLPMGADDDMIAKHNSLKEKEETKNKFGFSSNDFIIVSGGKIDFAKTQTLLLMGAVNELEKKNVKLLVFGSVDKQLKERFDSLCSDRVKYAGWANVDDSYRYFGIADLVVFPGRHSVYWEQVAGMGIPMIVKYWPGTTHIDRGGNVKFLYEDTVDEIKEVVKDIFFNGELEKMESVAQNNKRFFSYRNIAERCIE